jgi:hypothetical protein
MASDIRIHHRQLVAKNAIDQQPEQPHAKVNDEHSGDVPSAHTFRSRPNPCYVLQPKASVDEAEWA